MNYSGTNCILSALVIMASCSSHDMWDVPHYGSKDVQITSFSCDTITLDAKRTSMLGEWLMVEDRLYFFDEAIVGVKEYGLEGEFIQEYIRHGRGPGEMVSSSWAASYDRRDSSFVLMDSGMAKIHGFDRSFKKEWESKSAFYLLDTDSLNHEAKWRDLLTHPSPERFEIYEYNMDCRRIASDSGKLYIPIVSDHIKFNKYYLAAGSRTYFREAYLFLKSNADREFSELRLLGHYPPAYRKGTLSVFSEYDFYPDEGGITVSFAADSLIYHFNRLGDVDYTFGCGDAKIAGRYPAVRSFEAYEKEYRAQRKEYGYYGRLVRSNGNVFRTCHLDKDGGWVLQIFDDGTKDMVGYIPIGGNWEILGYNDGLYYAYIGENLEEENFRIVRFKFNVI